MQNITFDEYEHDMKETADLAAGIITKLKKEIRERDQLIAALIIAAGGKIEVTDHVFYDIDRKTLCVERWEANMSKIFEVR